MFVKVATSHNETSNKMTSNNKFKESTTYYKS